jgi:Bacterial Ig-like domain (group 3)
LKTFLWILEQVHVIRMFCRGLRLSLVAALGIALATPGPAATAPSTQLTTHTTLLVDTRDVNGHTQANFFVAVSGADGSPVTGSIAITDAGKPLAGFTLGAQGEATANLDLAPGYHSFSAVYIGDQGHLGSRSQVAPISAATSSTPDFSVSISPATLSLKQGQAGSATVSVTPVNAASLATPMFVTISCSGLPDQSACTFTPENIEIPIGATTPISSSLVLSTQTGTLTTAKATPHRDARPIAWAILPGSLALLGFAFGMRRRRFLSRIAMVGLVAFVSVLGTTACSPLYNYYNHGPTHNLPTPAGTYTVTITAQSSNGVTATTHNTTVALTVTQ